MAAAAFWAIPVHAYWDTSQLTQNNVGELFSRTNGVDVAWIQRNDLFRGWDIYRFDGQSTTRITDPSLTSGVDSFVLTDSYIFFTAYDNPDGNHGHHQVYAYDLGTGVTAQLTDNNSTKNNLAAQGSNVVWEQRGVASGDLFYHSAASGQSKLARHNDYFINRIPSVFGPYIAWEAGPSDLATEVYLYNEETGETKTLTGNSVYDGAPAVYGSLVAYNHIDGSDSHVYIYDDSTGTTTAISNLRGQPKVSDSTVAWPSTVTDLMTRLSVTTLLSYDIGTQATTPVATMSPAVFPSTGLRDLALDGADIAWAGFDGHDLEVYFYDGDAHSVTQITDNELDDYSVGLNGRTLVWNSNPVSRAVPLKETEVFISRYVVPEPKASALAVLGVIVTTAIRRAPQVRNFPIACRKTRF